MLYSYPQNVVPHMAFFGTIMSIDRELEQLKSWGEREIRQYLAAKIRRTRRGTKESQKTFAERIGVPLRTYKRFEAHGQGTLQTFVRALQGIGRTRYLFMLFPQATPISKNPLAQILNQYPTDH